jgi:kynurenine formamidase
MMSVAGGSLRTSVSIDRRLIDVSHTLEHGRATYRGLPAPVICDYLSREESRARYVSGTEFHIGKIEMVGNTGTYVDSPFHRYPDGNDLAALPLESLANLDCVVARVPIGHTGPIDRRSVAERDVRDRAVLVQTGWDRHWGTDQYFEDTPISPVNWPSGWAVAGSGSWASIR